MDAPAATPGGADGEEVPLTLLWGTWEMWCDIPQRTPVHSPESANWLEQVKSIGLFDSAEGFWGIHNCTILPSQLPPNGSYYLFRKHIAPMWEHEANRRGGKWVVPFSGRPSRGEDDVQLLDVAWQTLCLSAIGELFPGAEEEICGVTVSRGKQRPVPSGHAATPMGEWKLCLWTRSADDETVQMDIAHYIKKELNAQFMARELNIESASRVGEGKEGVRPSGRSPAAKKRERVGAPASITYVAHRELMEAKQEFAKNGVGRTQAFKPRYTLSM